MSNSQYESLASCIHYINFLQKKIENYTENANTTSDFSTNGLNDIYDLMALLTELTSHIVQNTPLNDKMPLLPMIKSTQVHQLSVIKTMIQAQNKNDKIALMDLLEFELTESLSSWKNKIIPALIQTTDKQKKRSENSPSL